METYSDTYQRYCKYCREVAGLDPPSFEGWMKGREVPVKPNATKEFLDVLEDKIPAKYYPNIPSFAE